MISRAASIVGSDTDGTIRRHGLTLAQRSRRPNRPVPNLSATGAGRNFSELLDAVEHRHESFVAVRKGRSIARIVPESGTSGTDVKELLRGHRADTAWTEDLRGLCVLAVLNYLRAAW